MNIKIMKMILLIMIILLKLIITFEKKWWCIIKVEKSEISDKSFQIIHTM